ncbi:trafficking protein particle complex subunit 12 [Coccinella septempunctata]|uniref:trafficking protein particle complex subunit 12 n=1 Tax=Coccinella septempunctata TaxID=41139 RepID=UPI001D09979A|nr:trafficking protein particle complex subunit 12 [Coccinella septempunctata]
MSGNLENEKPSLSQYFGSDSGSEDKTDFTTKLSDTSNKLNTLKLEGNRFESEYKNEPVVCRLFSDNVSQSKDPTAPFFDYFGSGSDAAMNHNNLDKNVTMPDLDIPTMMDSGFEPRVAVGSEAERRRDAWIPSEQTRQILIKCVTSTPGTFFPEREYLTMPGVLLEEELGDSVGEAVTVCLGETEAAERRIITANDVTQDERGLRELVQAGAYRAAINLTARLLEIYGQGKGRAGHPSKHSSHSLQLWFTRIALLVKTKLFNFAQAEAETFGDLDKPDVFYQFYPEMYGDRPGSIASFSFRLLLAELPMHCGKFLDSLPRLFNLWSIVKQIRKNLQAGLCEDGNPLGINEPDRANSEKLWRSREIRIIHSIIDCAICLKNFQLAIDLMREICEIDLTNRHTLLSALGRLHLIIGDIAGAEDSFNKASLCAQEMQFKDKKLEVRSLIDSGLLCIANKNYNEALNFFQEAKSLEPNKTMILNNMAVCHMYSGRLKDAISILESAIASNPPQALHESVILNLCTLYDMESSKGRLKKFALLRQMSRYQADAPTAILEKLYG